MSRARASSGEVRRMAAKVKTRVTAASTILGTAWRMDSLRRSASVVARLSRSPVPTDSTVDSGRPRTRRTNPSRVAARTRSPSSVACTLAARASRAWTTRMATKARARTSTRAVLVPAATDSTRWPSSRGPVRLATRAVPNSSRVRARRPALPRTKSPTQARTSARSASGRRPGAGPAPSAGAGVGAVAVAVLVMSGLLARGRGGRPGRAGGRGRRRPATAGCR